MTGATPSVETRPAKLPDVNAHAVGDPGEWSAAIEAFSVWLRMRGLAESTIELRRDHLRYVATRAGTDPAGLTGHTLRDIASRPRWSIEHRRAFRSSVRAFCGWACSTGILAEDISDVLPVVKMPHARPRPATDAIWSQLMSCDDSRVRLMSRLAGEAGLRRAEVARVHTDDLITDADGYVLIVHGKGGKQRCVPITDSLAGEILAAQPGWLFPSSKNPNEHISAEYVGFLVSECMPRGWSMHKLRHRYATRGYAATGNLRAVQEALGHASVATTERYTAVTARDVRSVSEGASS